MNTKNSNIILGDVEVDPSELESAHVKVRVTTLIDEDVLRALKSIGRTHGVKYQTLLNRVLRAYVEKRVTSKAGGISEQKVRRIVQEELRKRA